MPVKLFYENGKTIARDGEEVEGLKRSFYGTVENGELVLSSEEALYLMDIRGARCFGGEREMLFNELAEKFMGAKFLAKYMTYKDWRDRGLFLRPISETKGTCKKNPVVKYPSMEFKIPKYDVEGLFFPDDKITIVDQASIGRQLYDGYWIGQYGTYKAEERGKLLKLDQFETLFMINYGLRIKNFEKESLIEELEKDSDFKAMYDVFEDWRLRGYVLKTGFKFGTHFRIYFPGASPAKKGEWVHSKHVIHVFPRVKRMKIAEWARAIRVAHSVRKTFILAIPGKKRKSAGVSLSYLLYHRKKGGVETPATDSPSYVMLSLSEDESIGGAELADAIEEAKNLGLDLMLAIADRESSVTHYHVKRIELPKSKYEYYEIEWAQP